MNYNEIYQKLMNGVSQDEIAKEIAVEFNRAVEDYEKNQKTELLNEQIDETADCCAEAFNDLFNLIIDREGLEKNKNYSQLTGEDIINVVTAGVRMHNKLSQYDLTKLFGDDKPAQEKKNPTFEETMQDFFNIFGL